VYYGRPETDRKDTENSQTLGVNGTGVVDMGSALLLLSSEIFTAYKEGAGAVVDP